MSATTTQGHDEIGRSECWCCGVVDSPDRMVHLGNHPEVTLCVRCGRWAAQQARAIEDRGRTGAAVSLRDGLRRARRFVIDQGWQHSRVFGGPIRWIGKRLP
jgi:hypothetical protein